MPLTRLKLIWPLALMTIPVGAQPYGEQTVQREPARTISVDLLRYPLSRKALHMLQRALQTSEAGDHAGAVQQLQKTLVQYPNSAAYVYSLIGIEFLKTGEILKAVDALQHAVTLLPHDAANHANLGLALICNGRYDRAEPELKRALDLDSHNMVASRLLTALALKKNEQN